MSSHLFPFAAIALAVCSWMNGVASAQDRVIAFAQSEGRVVVRLGGQPLATYVYGDEKTPRPYFADLHAGGGPQLSRHHPPQAGDAKDHDLMHPGLWFALGDLSGNDNWRLKAKVVGEIVEQPSVVNGRGSFLVRNRYLSNDGKQALCVELCQYRFWPQLWGCLLIADSQFVAGDAGCVFGDQMDEMGLGVRVATPLSVNARQGGKIVNSDGGQNEKGVREQLAAWCDYSGVLEGKPAGIMLMSAADNPRETWWHARDYGFMCANPFRADKRRASNQPLALKAGETARFRFGISLHSEAAGSAFDPASAYRTFAACLGK